MNRVPHRLHSATDEGFTLIELLIVIVILGILAGIAIFGVSQFQDDAKSSCTKANNRIDATVSVAKTISSSGAYATGGNCT